MTPESRNGDGHAETHPVERASTTEGLPVAVSLGPTLEAAAVPAQNALIDARVIFICVLAIAIGIAGGFIAQGLMHLILFCPNLSFYGKASFAHPSPHPNHFGL